MIHIFNANADMVDSWRKNKHPEFIHEFGGQIKSSFKQSRMISVIKKQKANKTTLPVKSFSEIYK